MKALWNARSHLFSLWESVIDGIVDINTHRSRSFLQALGIILGVASVVATFGLIEGGKQQMKSVYDMTGGIRKMRIDNRQTTEASQNANEKASKGLTYDDALALKRQAKLIEIVEPTMQRDALVKAPGFEKTLEVSGATWGYEPMYNFHPGEGRFITDEDLDTSAKICVLGSTRRAQMFGARPALGQVISIDGSSYTVVGVMQRKEFRFNDADDNDLEWMNEFVFIPITSMLNRMQGDRSGQKIAFMNVQVRDLKDMDAAMGEVTGIVLRQHKGVKDFGVFNRAAQMRRMEENGRIYDVTFLVCGTISLLVGGIVIMNILLASFNERVREVGTRKALGATALNIMAQFLVESVVVTIFGGFLGIALGSAFTRAISALIQQPVVLTPQNAVIGMGFAVVVGIFFGFYPAIKAARLNPIQALRYE